MADVKKILSSVSGLSEEKMDSIWQEVKENRDKLESCKKHNFGEIEYSSVRRKYVCKNCGGYMDFRYVKEYSRGYIAAGGKEEDIYVLKEGK